MARIVILSVPAYGHLNPVLPIAKTLVERGHTVTVFNEASFEPLIRAAGADFSAYPPVIHLEDFSRTLKKGDLVAWLEMIFRATGPLVSSCYRALRDNPPDLILFDGVALWGEMLTRKLRVPSISISTTFAFEVFRELSGPMEFVRYELSVVPALPGFAWGAFRMILNGPRNLPWRLPIMPRQGSELTLMLTSREVHPQTPLFDGRRYAFVGCSIEPSTRLEQFDISRLDGRPLIYVSLGTLHHGNAAFFDTCIEAFRSTSDCQVLMSVGRGTDLARFAGAPDHFIVAEAVPQLEILKRADIFVTHAGLNSMHESLWEGIPMVAVPQQVEQWRNARAMARAGAGVVLKSERWGKPVPAETLRNAVADIRVDRTRYATAARRLGESLRAGGGYVEAANLVERTLESRSAGVQPRHAIGSAADETGITIP